MGASSGSLQPGRCSSWCVDLMFFAGIVETDVGIRPFGYVTSMVVTIALWLTLAPAIGAVARPPGKTRPQKGQQSASDRWEANAGRSHVTIRLAAVQAQSLPGQIEANLILRPRSWTGCRPGSLDSCPAGIVQLWLCAEPGSLGGG